MRSIIPLGDKIFQTRVCRRWGLNRGQLSLLSAMLTTRPARCKWVMAGGSPPTALQLNFRIGKRCVSCIGVGANLSPSTA